MSTQDLDTLRDLTVTAEDLAIPWDYFMSNCAESPTFIQSCTPTRGPEPVRLAVAAVYQEMLRRPIDPAAVVYMELKGTPFVHGAAMSPRGLLTFYYFVDIGIGIAVNMMAGSGEITLARLRAMKVAGGGIEM